MWHCKRLQVRWRCANTTYACFCLLMRMYRSWVCCCILICELVFQVLQGSQSTMWQASQPLCPTSSSAMLLLLNAVIANVGLDKQTALSSNASGWHRPGLCMPCPSRWDCQCMIRIHNPAWYQLMSCLCLPLYCDTVCTCANTAAASGSSYDDLNAVWLLMPMHRSWVVIAYWLVGLYSRFSQSLSHSACFEVPFRGRAAFSLRYDCSWAESWASWMIS